MGWRKLIIQDGDLARCSELQRPRRYYAELRPWGSLMRQHLREACLNALRLVGSGGPVDVQCSNCSLLVQ
jgi:hypothetical protein